MIKRKLSSGLVLWALTFGVFGLTFYPIIIEPMISPQKYKKIQEITRKNINQEEIQPGGMRVWTDPFDRKKTEGSH